MEREEFGRKSFKAESMPTEGDTKQEPVMDKERSLRLRPFLSWETYECYSEGLVMSAQAIRGGAALVASVATS